jgi:hypothetical protein
MKKKPSRLQLHRETLRALDGAPLGEAAGASGNTSYTCTCTQFVPPSGCECPDPGTQFCV